MPQLSAAALNHASRVKPTREGQSGGAVCPGRHMVFSGRRDRAVDRRGHERSSRCLPCRLVTYPLARRRLELGDVSGHETPPGPTTGTPRAPCERRHAEREPPSTPSSSSERPVGAARVGATTVEAPGTGRRSDRDRRTGRRCNKETSIDCHPPSGSQPSSVGRGGRCPAFRRLASGT